MTAEHLNIEQRSDEWFDLRKGIITSSDISAIMAVKGLGEGAHTLAKEKAWQALHGFDEDTFDTFDMQRGRELEPLAFESASQHLAKDFLEIRKTGFFVNSEFNTGSSPDGVISNNCGYEAKAPRFPKLRDILIDENFTPEKNYFLQMQHQILVCGFDGVLHHNFGVYLGKPYERFTEVKPCDTTINLMAERILLFNGLVENYKQKYIDLGL